MTTKSFYIVANLCISLLLLAGCVQKIDNPNTNPDNQPSSDKYFDFNVNQSVSLSIDYCFANKDYVVLFEVYDQNPITINEDGQTEKKAIEPIYRAATDGSGKFSANITILSALSKIWLHSDYIGTLSPVELEITNNKIVFNQNEYIDNQRKATTKAVTANNRSYPDGWLTLGDWNQVGTPNYLEADRKMPATNILYALNSLFIQYNKKTLNERYPEFFKAGMSSSISIIKPTKVYMTFVNSSASWSNTVGYFVYETGKEPQNTEDIKRTLVFPHVKSLSSPIGALAAGDRVQLKYWDGTKYLDEFPAGVSIGWWLEGMSFKSNTGNITPSGDQSSVGSARFSLDHLNKNNVRRVVALGDPVSGQLVALGFEDNTDSRYNDATFALEVPEKGAIDNEKIPSIPETGIPPTGTENYILKSGTLLFEDLWPYSGDYDMNDVMIRYTSKVYKNIVGNTIYKIEEEYTPYHAGGSLTSGFGIQFPKLALSDVHLVKIDGGTPSKFMEGNKLEPGQTYPTIILFDNVRSVLNSKITMTIELNDVQESAVTPPYNPFIIPESNKSRDKEVHLVKFQPTDKMNHALLGTGNDGSRPKDGLFYVINGLEKQYPFALDLPFISDMPVPTESAHIDVTYPEFRNWVESKGQTNKDWYLKPLK